MRKAVIDLGTNTFNLLIAEASDGKLNVIHSDKLPVLLGMGGINQGIIAEPAMQRAKDALMRFKAACVERDVQLISGIGTSALRAAKNSSELIEFAQRKLNISIEIISGKREAELIYKGVRMSHSFDSSGVIMDIGGGSTEFVGADSKGMLWSDSFDIGVSRIFQQLHQPEEFNEEHVQAIKDFLEERCGAELRTHRSPVLIGSSGSFETVYEMIYMRRFEKIGESIPIDFDRMIDVLTQVISSTLEERMHNDWITPIRKKMMPVAAVNILWAVEQMGTKEVWVSPYSLKEGVFA